MSVMRWRPWSKSAPQRPPFDVDVDWLGAAIRERRRNRHGALRTSGIGERISTSTASGLEFDRLRQFEPGDDVRQVDWRVSIATNRLHTRLYRSSERLNSLVVLDRSASMGQPQHGANFLATPWWFARTFVLSLAYAHLLGRGSLSVVLCETDSDRAHELPPCRSSADIVPLVKALDAVSPAGRAVLPQTHQLRAMRRRPGLVVVVSDFLGVESGQFDELRRVAARSSRLAMVRIDGSWLEFEQLRKLGTEVRIQDSEIPGQRMTIRADDAARRGIEAHADALEATMERTAGRDNGRVSCLPMHQMSDRNAVLHWMCRELDELGVL